MIKRGDWNGIVHILLLNLTEKRYKLCVGGDLVTYRTNKGKDISCLEAETKKVDLSAIVKFIDDMLPKIIHHMNQLKLLHEHCQGSNQSL